VPCLLALLLQYGTERDWLTNLESKLVLAALANCLIAVAAPLAYAADCSDVLKYGVWEAFNFGTDFRSNESLKNYMCTQRHSQLAASLLDAADLKSADTIADSRELNFSRVASDIVSS
jgi:hypothetical protein